jgi:hypothetical protein
MTLDEKINFTDSEAETLFKNPFARERTNFISWAQERIPTIAQIYEVSNQEVKRAVLIHPPFAGLNHERVVSEATSVYGDESKVKRAVLSFPPFAGLNHERVVSEATSVYGDESKVKRAVLIHPPFASYNHERVVSEATSVYGDESKVKRAVLSFPQFAGLNHERVVSEATSVYGDESKVKRAVLSFPPFASYNHERVVRQKTRLGRLIKLTKNEIIDKLLNKPVSSSYSAKRYLAGIDVCRNLKKEGFKMNTDMLKTFFNYYSKSPYVPNSNRRRISQVDDGKEPPLLIAMRKSLLRQSS